MDRRAIENNASERARWLAELSTAIEEAQWLLWRLGVSEGDNSEAKELYGRLETARAETESLRLRGFRPACNELGPNWTELVAHGRGLFDAAG